MPLLKLVNSKVNFAKQTEEYYNAIRTNIQFSGAQMKVIAVSSVEAGEGKSTTLLFRLLVLALERCSLMQIPVIQFYLEHLNQMSRIKAFQISFLEMLLWRKPFVEQTSQVWM